MAPNDHLMSPTQVNLVEDDFRAPPPSPIAAPRSSTTSIANDQVLSNFLYSTLRVPDLVLPHHIFPKLSPSNPSNSEHEDVPVVDFCSLAASTAAREVVMSSLQKIGCFQLINHGIDSENIQFATKRAAEVFSLSPEKKAALMRTAELAYGFEDNEHVDHETIEEFVWCSRDDELRLIMDRVWPVGYPRFRGEMESLSRATESILKTILQSLQPDDDQVPTTADGESNLVNTKSCPPPQLYDDNSVCYIYKNVAGQSKSNMMGHDVLRMMVKGSHDSHALSLHICGIARKQFQLYSKKGWLSFVPSHHNALIVTSGDQALLQAWTGKPCKSVVGRSIYAREEYDRDHHIISMTFHFNPRLNLSSATSGSNATLPEEDGDQKNKVVSLRQQALFAIFLTIACQLSLRIYRTFYEYFSV